MAGGGGAWKVAYADFVTAMMAFFMVMWLTAKPGSKKAVGGYFQDPWGTSSESSTPTMQTPAGLSGNAPFGDAPTGVLPNRSPQANTKTPRRRKPGAASVWQQKQKVYLLAQHRSQPAGAGREF